ncbi:fimv [Bifidobacterium ramosum]|uniref:Fimv n=1 Tax=Bifidobacterium ramosum TaxID=1798158 RepID=A0A6L4WXG8_9BIFI|nr:fimv [Bifidobacterium ramosum]
MSDERRSLRWLVRVKGCDQVSVLPSERLEIGRRPIRPLPDTGIVRFEVPDDTRSMSKRHAVFAVSASGDATICDIGSTNGTYMVRADGTLVRLPAHVEFPLPSAAVRMQFGDVPVDFIRVDEPEPQPKPQVTDLFEYAMGDAKPEPDAAELSVDDILDLRAGEPTSAFTASSVASRVNELKMASLRSFMPHVGAREPEDNALIADSMPLTVQQQPHEPRDLFVDALAESSELPQLAEPKSSVPPVASDEEPAQDVSFGSPSYVVPNALKTDTVAPADRVMPISVIAHPVRPVHAEAEHVAVSDDGTSSDEGAPADQSAVSSQDMPQDHTAASSSANQETEDQSTTVVPSASDQPATNQSTADQSTADQPTADQPTSEPSVAASSSASSAEQPVVQPTEPSSDVHDQLFRPMTAADQPDVAQTIATQQFTTDQPVRQPSGYDQPDATGTYAPVFEPGSVFDRVAKGDFKRPEPSVEVDGLTSDEAKRTGDFSVQFHMARYPQLLPFLAMNPSLYDDLYAWLSAQGNRDIDAALENNPGYQDYRKAVGK